MHTSVADILYRRFKELTLQKIWKTLKSTDLFFQVHMNYSKVHMSQPGFSTEKFVDFLEPFHSIHSWAIAQIVRIHRANLMIYMLMIHFYNLVSKWKIFGTSEVDGLLSLLLPFHIRNIVYHLTFLIARQDQLSMKKTMVVPTTFQSPCCTAPTGSHLFKTDFGRYIGFKLFRFLSMNRRCGNKRKTRKFRCKGDYKYWNTSYEEPRMKRIIEEEMWKLS